MNKNINQSTTSEISSAKPSFKQTKKQKIEYEKEEVDRNVKW